MEVCRTGARLYRLEKLHDDRGWLCELFRQDDLEVETVQSYCPVMAYASITLPGVMRGPHEHGQQADLFSFIGPGTFDLYLWNSVETFREDVHSKQTWRVGENCPHTVWVPPGVIHAYVNVSDQPGLVFNAPNRLYGGPGKHYGVDEVRHEEEYERLISESPGK